MSNQHTNQPDHTEEVLEMVTNTNQASEDELQIELELLYKCIGYDIADGLDRKELWIKEIGFVVRRLISTEKLKLLDEVRERVIGEDLPPDVATDSGIGYSRQQFAINMGKAGQRKKLTKLEAEL
jgi:hypothetical protein